MPHLRNEVTIVDDTFTEVAYLEKRLKVSYAIALNTPTRCSIDLPLDDPKILQCTPQRYALIRRDGVELWCGRLQMAGWMDDPKNAGSDVYPLDAWDMAAEMGTRTLPRPTGMDFNERTGAADDVAKAYVYNEAGAGAIAARRVNGLYVQADAGLAASVTKLLLGGSLLDHLNNLSGEKAFYWGLVPHYTASVFDGMEFRTAYPFWGADLSKGEVGELVLAQDNHNIATLAYKFDLTGHVNHVYVTGPGEDQKQLVVEADNRVAMTALLGYDPGRRERWISSDALTSDGLLADGNAYLAQYLPIDELLAVVLPDVITPAHLGARITVFDLRYGRAIEKDCIITEIAFVEDNRGVETVTPTLKVVV